MMPRLEIMMALVGISIVGVAATIEKEWDLACEPDDLKLNKCSKSNVIEVTKALFGRNKNIYCQLNHNNTQKCGMKDVLDIVRHECDGESSCSIPAKTSHLGEVEGCTYVSKYLEVTYICVQKRTKSPRLKPNAELNPDEPGKTVVLANEETEDDLSFSAVTDQKANNGSLVDFNGFYILLLVTMAIVYSFK